MKFESINFGGGGQPAISVTIPMYNSRDYVEDCIRSILNQTFENFEVIVMDDCSTDGSLELVNEKFGNDPRLKLFRHEKNAGASETGSDAMSLACGKYVKIVDNDDALVPNALQILYEAAEKSQADVVHTTKYFSVSADDFSLDKNSKAILVEEQDPILGMQPPNFRDRIYGMGSRTFFPEWLDFFRRSFLFKKNLTQPNIELATDLFFTVRLFLVTEKIFKIDTPVYYYRRGRVGSVTNSKISTRLQTFVRDLPFVFRYMKEVFARKDLIEPISEQLQLDLTTKLIATMFINAIYQQDQDIFSRQEFDDAIEKMSKIPELYERDVMENILKSFVHLMILSKGGAMK